MPSARSSVPTALLSPNAPPVTINHRGAQNARVVEKWAREHFVNPEEVFVTGSSAGAYGTIAGAAYLLRSVYTASRFNVVGDTGTGVVTQEFVSTQLLGWGIEKNLPRWTKARAIVQDTAARAPNFRYYIGAASRHTIWGSDKIYTEPKGGVIPFAEWVEQMRMDDPAWSNHECTDCSLNPGDPAPSPPVPPFNADGTVSCPAS